MNCVLYNDNSVLKGFHGTSEWLLEYHGIHVEVSHLFQQDVSFLMQHRHQSSPLFSPCFWGDFYMFEIRCFTNVFVFWRFLQFSYSLEIFLIHFNPVLPLCRPVELNCILMSCFLNNDKIALKWVKENLTGWLNITPVWKPYLVSGKCFFSPAIQVRKFSSRFILF